MVGAYTARRQFSTENFLVVPDCRYLDLARAFESAGGALDGARVRQLSWHEVPRTVQRHNRLAEVFAA